MNTAVWRGGPEFRLGEVSLRLALSDQRGWREEEGRVEMLTGEEGRGW